MQKFSSNCHKEKFSLCAEMFRKVFFPFLLFCATSKNWCSQDANLIFMLTWQTFYTNFLHMHQDIWRSAKSRYSNIKFAIEAQWLSHQTNVFDSGVAESICDLKNKIQIRLNAEKLSIIVPDADSPYINLVGLNVSNRISYKRHLFFTHARQRHTNPSQHWNRRQECLQKLRLHTMLLVSIQNWYAIDFNVAHSWWFQCFRNGFKCFGSIIEMNYPITNF